MQTVFLLFEVFFLSVFQVRKEVEVEGKQKRKKEEMESNLSVVLLEVRKRLTELRARGDVRYRSSGSRLACCLVGGTREKERMREKS